MRITIIAEEDLAHKVLVGFQKDFAMSGLRRSLNMLLDEGVDTFATILVVADLDRVTMDAKMNARRRMVSLPWT